MTRQGCRGAQGWANPPGSNQENGCTGLLRGVLHRPHDTLQGSGGIGEMGGARWGSGAMGVE